MDLAAKLKTRRTEVEQKSNAYSCNTKIVQKLRILNRCQPLNRLHFDDDLSINNNIRSESIEENEILVSNVQGCLPLIRKALAIQFVAKSFLIYALKKSGTENSMNLESRTNDLVGYVFVYKCCCHSPPVTKQHKLSNQISAVNTFALEKSVWNDVCQWDSKARSVTLHL